MIEKNLHSTAENRNAVHEARALIEKMFEKGIRPIVTVPKEHEQAIRAGLHEHTSWIPGLHIIAGTMGIEPYFPANEERVIVRVKPKSVENIHPRLTGPDRAFHGVVTLTGPISPDEIDIIDRKVA